MLVPGNLPGHSIYWLFQQLEINPLTSFRQDHPTGQFRIFIFGIHEKLNFECTSVTKASHYSATSYDSIERRVQKYASIFNTARI